MRGWKARVGSRSFEPFKPNLAYPSLFSCAADYHYDPVEPDEDYADAEEAVRRALHLWQEEEEEPRHDPRHRRGGGGGGAALFPSPSQQHPPPPPQWPPAE